MIVNKLSIFIYNYTTKVRHYINCIYHTCVSYSQIFRSWLWYRRQLRIGLLFFLYLVSVYGLSFSKSPEENEEEAKGRQRVQAMELSFHNAAISQEVNETVSSMEAELEEESAYATELEILVDETVKTFFETTDIVTDDVVSVMLQGIDETASDLENSEVRARKNLEKLKQLTEHKKFLIGQNKLRLSNHCCRLQEVILENSDITHLEDAVKRNRQRLAHQEVMLKQLEEICSRTQEKQLFQEERNNSIMAEVASLEDLFYTQCSGEEDHDENTASTEGNYTQEGSFDDMPPLEGEEDEDITDQPQPLSLQENQGNQSSTIQEDQEGNSSQGGSVSGPHFMSSSGSNNSQGGASGGTSTLIPGYNVHSQMSSLQGLQCVLLSAVEQVAENLKVLILKAINVSKENKFNVASFNYRTSKKNTSSQKHFSANVPANKQGVDSRIVSSLDKFHVFAVMDSYLMNLESKVRSGQLGIITNIFSDLSIGLAYAHNNSSSKEHIGAMFGSVIGSAKAKMNTNALSAIFIWNTNKTGFSGCISSYYGWGQMKNARQYLHTEEIISSKGSPDIMLGGGLIQLGYNCFISKSVMITPYIEYLFITTGWKEYNEITGTLPSHISSTKEQLISKNIGIRSRINLMGNSQLQTWVTGAFGQRKLGTITAQPLKSTNSIYKAMVQKAKNKYVQGEGGLSYEIIVTNNCKIGLSGDVQFEKNRPLKNGNVRCFFHLTY
ncbi:autotransporter outer membrane beta-barrel domain-containing protein [Lawsonia intracellularis]|uniref:NA n=1 Tax=Lawsonia intracellularis (strain PHE/MN1-00) TaxID=363253 RepID=Q1MNZ9_LAWIP|nr:autotransporter outer membrane beta-barrel domain-containing protein [Lawsonia intracellularis]AGC50654.1 hypothetical protein LAW_20007 [Lawsonia intracellularis N343]KAA0204215.1 autotransporter domain-containing protein [Lawsonia intracellularis]MBZ3893287.1 autotransporter outer membrane beta-barrel domain-containing protein [Lawsonia intracellularis]RBN31868.1 autotransporter domain-containing protein [Lawsonia intracellularis]CAJ53905.1 NA [Lawsonia intracellularis PHE/MN1-00]